MLLFLFPALLFAQEDRVYKSLSEVKNPEDVYVLKLNYKRLHRIPDKVFLMTNLRVLDLGKNFIDSIPPQIANLKCLQELDLSRNHLRTIPPAVGELRQLRDLDLSRNPLLELPEEMGQLTKLEKLTLWSTGIISFPPTFVALNESLKVLDMRVCPMSWDDQQAIEELLPSARKRWDYVCNCK